MANSNETIFVRLKHSLQLLASPASVQLSALPDFVCKADELALEFDHWREVALDNHANELTGPQVSALTALDQALEQLTAKGGQHWTETAIWASPEWEAVRALAAKTLEAFGWSNERPPSYAHEYHKAKTRSRGPQTEPEE